MKDAPKRQPAGKKSQTKPGRPPEAVPQDCIEEIIAWVSEGKTLREYCRQEGKPAWRTVYGWLSKDEDFRARFARAREDGADAIAEEGLAILDQFPLSTANGSMDSAHVAWLRNRAEFRLKLLAKWFPQRYGDKQTVQHEGGIQLNVVTGVPDDS